MNSILASPRTITVEGIDITFENFAHCTAKIAEIETVLNEKYDLLIRGDGDRAALLAELSQWAAMLIIGLDAQEEWLREYDSELESELRSALAELRNFNN